MRHLFVFDLVTLRACESPIEQAQRKYDNSKRACAGAEEHCGRDKAATEACLWQATSSHMRSRKSALQLNINEPNRMRRKPSTAGSTASLPMFAPTMESSCTALPLPVVLITIEKIDAARSCNRPAGTRGVRSWREPRQFRGVRRASLPLSMPARRWSRLSQNCVPSASYQRHADVGLKRSSGDLDRRDRGPGRASIDLPVIAISLPILAAENFLEVLGW